MSQLMVKIELLRVEEGTPPQVVTSAIYPAMQKAEWVAPLGCAVVDQGLKLFGYTYTPEVSEK
jgi:hypothetical protein